MNTFDTFDRTPYDDLERQHETFASEYDLPFEDTLSPGGFGFQMQPDMPDMATLRAAAAASVNYTPAVDAMTQSAFDKKFAETVQHPPCHPLTALLSNPDASDSALLDECYGQTVTFTWRGCPGVYPRQQMTGVIVGLETWHNGVRMLQVRAKELNVPKWIELGRVQFVNRAVEAG